jgi:hypothetical protein
LSSSGSSRELQTKGSQQIGSKRANILRNLRIHQKRKRNHRSFWDSPAEGQSTSLMLTPPDEAGVTLAVPAVAASAATRRSLLLRRLKLIAIALPALREEEEGRPALPPLARRRDACECDAAARHCFTLARAKTMLV